MSHNVSPKVSDTSHNVSPEVSDTLFILTCSKDLRMGILLVSSTFRKIYEQTEAAVTMEKKKDEEEETSQGEG